MTMVARVTTIEGSPEPRDQDAVEPAEEGTGGQHTHRHQGHGQAGLGQEPRRHSADRELGADRDVDVAGQDDQGHPDGRDQHRRVARDHVAQVGAPEERGRPEGQRPQESGDGREERPLPPCPARPRA
jgi:hypothetical protein